MNVLTSVYVFTVTILLKNKASSVISRNRLGSGRFNQSSYITLG